MKTIGPVYASTEGTSKQFFLLILEKLAFWKQNNQLNKSLGEKYLYMNMLARQM